MLTVARRGLLRVSTRVVPNSPYSVVCVAIGRGYLDDPPACQGLAHLFEHVWFTHRLSTPTLEWGETCENMTLLYHACPPDEVAAVLSAIARRLESARQPAGGLPLQIASARSLIELEWRTRQENRRSRFLRRDIARALRGDPEFDPSTVSTGEMDPEAVADALVRFPLGRAHAVCVAGPTSSISVEDIASAFSRAAPMSNGESAAQTAGLSGCWTHETEDAPMLATVWVLPRTPEVAAAAWLLGNLFEGRPRSTELRWVSGRILSPRGAAPIRGQHLYAVAAGAREHDGDQSLQDHLLPVLRGDLADLGAARASVLETRTDVAELAAIDAADLLDGPSPRCGHDDVLATVRAADEGTIHRFTDLLVASPRAEFRTRRAAAR